ncbi:MAG TPA: DUF881 domain-containing protein [Nocardioidaceae bacterium]|nr:DUF881 domain-containing protein [Nocardioidaceae bacterium]
MPDQAADESTGRARLVAALRRPTSRSQLTAGVLLGVLGFAAVVQMHSSDQADRYAGASQEDLIQLINAQAVAEERVEDQIAALEATRNELEGHTADTEVALELARRQASALGILTGTSPAVGPGIEVAVDGPPLSVGSQELVSGIQELRSAGAEAMQVNGVVRLVGSSSIVDGPGDSVIIDGTQVAAPFLIEAIGNAAALEKAVFFPDGFAEDIESADGEVSVRRLNRVEITSTRTVSPPQYAEPVPEG